MSVRDTLLTAVSTGAELPGFPLEDREGSRAQGADVADANLRQGQGYLGPQILARIKTFDAHLTYQVRFQAREASGYGSRLASTLPQCCSMGRYRGLTTCQQQHFNARRLVGEQGD